MALDQLTDVWCEVRQLSDALDSLPGHVDITVPPPDHPDPVATAEPAQAILASSGITYDRNVFARLPRLRILVRTGIGVDNVNTADASAAGVVFCNTPAGPTESTAEHTVGLMLSLAKRIPEGQAQLARGEFAPRGISLGNELMGKTLGLVGFGRIGRRVGHICQNGFGMDLLTHDPILTASQITETGLQVQQVDLETLWAQSDFISLHAPSIPSTYHMVNAESIAQMKPGAYLFNLARGPLVDAEALLEALDEGKLAGAGLDVFEPEPPPVHSRLRTHPRIVATPHSATTTREARHRIEVMAVAEIQRYFSGQAPLNALNPEVWSGPRN